MKSIIFFYLLLLLLLPLASTKHHKERFRNHNNSSHTNERSYSTPETYLNCWNQLGRSRERSIVEFFFFLFFFIFHHHITKGWNNWNPGRENWLLITRQEERGVILSVLRILRIIQDEISSRRMTEVTTTAAGWIEQELPVLVVLMTIQDKINNKRSDGSTICETTTTRTKTRDEVAAIAVLASSRKRWEQ